MRVSRVLLAVVTAALTVHCAGGKHQQIVAPTGEKLKVPEWYADPPEAEDNLVAVATATSRDLQTAVDKAKQDGRTEIARQLDVRMEGMSKRFVEETGLRDDAELLDMFTQVSRSVVSDSLVGSHQSKQELTREGPVYRAYVMMEMPIGEANARLVSQIKAQRQLYTRFRATEAFQELDEMVDEYENWKEREARGQRGNR